jgi:hypothetical protein
MVRLTNAAGAALVLAAGCTSLDGLSSEAQNQPAAGTGTSTQLSGLACNASMPFKSATQVAADGHDSFAARYDAKKSLVVFNRGPDSNIVPRIGTSLVDATGQPFAPITPQPVVQTTPAPFIVFPTISKDGLVVYYQAYFPGPRDIDPPWSSIFVATRASLSGSFENGRVVVPAGTGNDYAPYLIASTNVLYWGHINPDANTAHIMRWPVDKQGDPKEMFTSGEPDMGNPVVTPDELTLFYGSSRQGTRDVFMATRATTSEPFANGVRLDALSTEVWDEVPTWVSEDACELVFERKNATTQESEVWSAVRR